MRSQAVNSTMTHQHDHSLEPARFLTENLDILPRGRALDVAMGSGRNAIYLAKMGFEVELLEMFRDFRCLRYREGLAEKERAVASIIAEKL
jgi:tellurite methyltransferase